MELGATVCLPNAEPRCGECPASAACAAYQAQRCHVTEGGDLAAEGAPRVTNYPTKVCAGREGRGQGNGLLHAHACSRTSYWNACGREACD